jgi:hypothetical protein
MNHIKILLKIKFKYYTSDISLDMKCIRTEHIGVTSIYFRLSVGSSLLLLLTKSNYSIYNEYEKTS